MSFLYSCERRLYAQVGGAKYRLFGVTCHRGVEPRFGHYTSYVRAPNGSWYHADDEDMTSIPVGRVLGDRTAYLLSYIRIGVGGSVFTTKTPSSMNGNRPAQTPISTNGTYSTPVMSMLAANGHRPTVIPNGHSSPIKRMREDDHLVNGHASHDAKRQALTETVHAPPPYSPAPRIPSSTHSPPDERPSRFGYNPSEPRTKMQRETPAYQHISPNSKKRRNKGGGGRRGAGPPMPFTPGGYQGGGKGFGSRPSGVFSRMKGRS